MIAPGHGRPRVLHRGWSILFGVAGLALLPWIVLLYLLQPRTAAVGDLPLAAGGAVAAITLGLVASVVLALLGSAFLVTTTSATAALALCAGFFHLVTGTATHTRAAVTTALVLGPVALLCAGIAWYEAVSTRSRIRSGALALILVVAAVATVLAWTRSAAAGFPAQNAHHLKLTWTVLDIAEAATLLATAAALRWRPRVVPAVASAAGALLCCDVWFNTVGAVGEARTDGVQMAFVSIPLAVAAFAVAAWEVRRTSGR